jgi:hypothetical protein
MPGTMALRVWDVEHGACAMLHHTLNGVAGSLKVIIFWVTRLYNRFCLGLHRRAASKKSQIKSLRFGELT